MVFPQTVLPLRTELFYDGAWQDITSHVYSRSPISITRGRGDESAQVETSSLTLTLNNRDGRYSPRNPRSPLYGKIGRNTPIRQSIVGPGYAQFLPATGSSQVATLSTPDTAALDITGDIDVRWDMDLTSWTDDFWVIGKWNEISPQRSWAVFLSADRRFRFYGSGNGSTLNMNAASAVLPIQQGRVAFRVTVDVDNGSGGRTVRWYTSDSIYGTWTQWFSASYSGTITFFNSSAPLTIGTDSAQHAVGATIRGRLYAAEVRSGIDGTVVARPDLEGVANGATSFGDSAGRTWTASSAVEITNRDTRFVGEVPSWPTKWDTSGKDVYTEITANGILRRLGQGQPALLSTMKSGVLGLSNLVAYWPCEDGDRADRIASGLDDGQPMLFNGGNPNLASDSSFDSSMPIPSMGGAYFLGRVGSYTSTGKIQVRSLIHVSGNGNPDNGSIMRLMTNGTAGRWDIRYKTGGGGLQLDVYNTAGDPDTLLHSSGVIGFATDDKSFWLSLECTQNGSNIDYQFGIYEIRTTGNGAGYYSGTVTGRTLGRATGVAMNSFRNLDQVSFGHVTVQTGIDSIFNLSDQINAYRGETAGTRIRRLCAENGIAFEGSGPIADSERMGGQRPLTLLELIRECADADLGLLYEPRDWTAIGYRPRTALYNQAVDVTLDYEQHELNALTPTDDDLNVRNDITVQRVSGSSFRATDTTSPMGTLPPPAGVGTYADSPTINVFADSQLDDQAGWRLALGTIKEARYPSIYLNLAAPAFTGSATLTPQVAACDIGSRLVVVNPPDWLPPEQISQLVQGYNEVLSQYQWDVTFNTSPNSPYESVGRYNTTADTRARYTSDGSFVNTAFNASATSISIKTPTGPKWTSADGPYNVMIGGEVMTVTNVSGTGTPQTFTVVRGVNGVTRSHAVDEQMELYLPTIYAL